MIFSEPRRVIDLEGHRDVARVQVLHARVEVLDVLAHDDEVHALSVVARGHAGDLPRRADVGVGLEELAQGDVGRLLAESHRGLQRALEGDAGAGDRIGRLLRHAGAVTALEDLGAGLRLLPFDGHAGGLDDAARGQGDLRTDAVAGDEGDAVAHGSSREQQGSSTGSGVPRPGKSGNPDATRAARPGCRGILSRHDHPGP